jgi:hypothetical protein
LRGIPCGGATSIGASDWNEHDDSQQLFDVYLTPLKGRIKSVKRPCHSLSVIFELITSQLLKGIIPWAIAKNYGFIATALALKNPLTTSFPVS